MITAIANLAQGWQNGEIAALVAKTNAKYAIVLEIEILGANGQYRGAGLEENKGAERYLYGDSPLCPCFLAGMLRNKLLPSRVTSFFLTSSGSVLRHPTHNKTTK